MVMPFVKCTPQPHPPTTIGRPMVVPLFQPIPHWTAHQYCRPTQVPPCNFICGSSTCAINVFIDLDPATWSLYDGTPQIRGFRRQGPGFKTRMWEGGVYHPKVTFWSKIVQI